MKLVEIIGFTFIVASASAAGSGNVDSTSTKSTSSPGDSPKSTMRTVQADSKEGSSCPHNDTIDAFQFFHESLQVFWIKGNVPPTNMTGLNCTKFSWESDKDSTMTHTLKGYVSYINTSATSFWKKWVSESVTFAFTANDEKKYNHLNITDRQRRKLAKDKMKKLYLNNREWRLLYANENCTVMEPVIAGDGNALALPLRKTETEPSLTSEGPQERKKKCVLWQSNGIDEESRRCCEWYFAKNCSSDPVESVYTKYCDHLAYGDHTDIFGTTKAWEWK